ncbi:TlpA disulfide reductase family protein [Pedobacter sp. Leaf132]|uniref:TlpA family protein disulfide reductase n=1 Tax=Pedobacter sp. Leaf132 TaxID=2876557 RepID=UPI001E650142|nr:TlpA disulfide reductase family protein [Pedobacter sp. Leaf132]
MKFNALLYLLICLILLSCSNEQEKPKFAASEILLSSDAFWNYYYNEINLSDDFIAFDTNNKPVSRKDFFAKLEEGYFLPISLETKDSLKHYKLYELTTAIDSELRGFIMNTFKTDVKFFNMEGSSIPEFNFTDLTSKVYNLKTVKDQLVLLKFWFIGCGACIEEMPALNKLVSKYSKRQNVKFLSLATDSDKILRKFLQKTKFNYATASVETDYVTEKIGVNSFPTHMIVKNGKILRVISTEKQLEEVLMRYQKP